MSNSERSRRRLKVKTSNPQAPEAPSGDASASRNTAPEEEAPVDSPASPAKESDADAARSPSDPGNESS